MQIKIKPTMDVPEIPSIVEIRSEGCLREVLSIVTPQLIDLKTGELKDDPDIWDVRLNGVSILLLKEGLNTKMHEGDVIGLELILMAGG